MRFFPNDFNHLGGLFYPLGGSHYTYSMVGEIHPNQHKDMTQHKTLTDHDSEALLAQALEAVPVDFEDLGVDTSIDDETQVWVDLPNPCNMNDMVRVSKAMMLHVNEHHNPSEPLTPSESLSNMGIKVEVWDGEITLKLDVGSEASDCPKGGDLVAKWVDAKGGGSA